MANPADGDKASGGAAIGQGTAGERLRASREGRDMSIRDVARELHLDAWMIEALERDDFAALGAPVFAKGHMRTYAALMGLNADDLLIAYYKSQGSTDAPPIVAGSAGRGHRSGASVPWVIIVVALVVVALSAAAAWWFLARDGEPDSLETASATADSAGATPAVITRNAPQLTAVDNFAAPPDKPAAADPAPATAKPVSAARSQEELPASPGPVVATPQAARNTARSVVAAPPADSTSGERQAQGGARDIQLRLQFTAESWVEVHDANRNRLLYGMGEANSVKMLSGPPPVQIFLGVARAVSIEVNGEPFNVPAQARRGNTARFEIAAAEPRS